MRSLAAIALLACAAQATTPSQTSLAKLVTDCELICLGKVVRVHDVSAGKIGGTVRIAEVEVSEWFKGIKRPKRIWYLAEGRIDADHSDAVQGERALLFLVDPEGPLWVEGELEQRLESPTFKKELNRLTGGARMLLLSSLGMGRMPLEQIEGVEYANITTWLIGLPLDAVTIEGPNPRVAELDRRVRFDDVRRLIERRLTPLEPPPGEAAALVFEFLEAVDTDVAKMEELGEELDEEETTVLLKLLDDPGFPRRDTVAEALCYVEGDSIIMRLTAKAVTRRRAAAFALFTGVQLELVGADDEAQMAAWRAAASDPDPEVRAYVTGTLMRLYELDALVTALSDEDARVSASARRALLANTDQTEEPDFPFAKAEAALLKDAAAEDLDVRRAVWELLGYVAGPASRAATSKALTDADRVVRVGAVRTLGRIGEAKRLAGFLSSKDVWVRRVAAHSLGRAKMAAGVEALAKVLGDPDDLVTGLAIDALGEIGPEASAAVPALEALLERPGGEKWTSSVAHALESIDR